RACVGLSRVEGSSRGAAGSWGRGWKRAGNVDRARRGGGRLRPRRTESGSSGRILRRVERGARRHLRPRRRRFRAVRAGRDHQPQTIPRLKAKIVAGSANNIFADEERDAAALDARGIIYAVDYVANSGGTILDTDRFRKGGLQRARAMANVRRIFERTEEVFAIADRDRISAYLAANRMAEARIEVLDHVRLLG